MISCIDNEELGVFSFLKSQPIAFESGVDRFKNAGIYKQDFPGNKNLNIGPGSYNPPNASVKSFQSSKPKIEWQQMAVLRLPNAPSIPSHNNVFGYEETMDGELIQQQNPEKVYSGSRGDSVGPGQYEMKNLVNRNTGTNWHSSKVNRPIFTARGAKNNMIGPGSYEIIKCMGTASQKVRGTSCFVSAVPKSTACIKENITRPTDDEEEFDENPPGPGSYNPKFGAFEQRSFPGPIQQFGCTAVRFSQVKNAMGSTLGPGQYGDFRQNYVYFL